MTSTLLQNLKGQFPFRVSPPASLPTRLLPTVLLGWNISSFLYCIRSLPTPQHLPKTESNINGIDTKSSLHFYLKYLHLQNKQGFYLKYNISFIDYSREGIDRQFLLVAFTSDLNTPKGAVLSCSWNSACLCASPKTDRKRRLKKL